MPPGKKIEPVETNPQEEISLKVKTPGKKRKWIIGLVVFLLLVGVSLWVSFAFSEVKIAIFPKLDKVALTETVTVKLDSSLDLENNIIPGQKVDNEKILAQDFQATGKATKEAKATGTITVYNAYSSTPRTFIPSRFVSADGKLFWSTEKISVPGYTKEGNKVIPGEVQVPVIASEAGPEYNIEATTFAMPGLAGTALYTTIYAKSFEPMTGGYIGESRKITESDLENAKNVLIDKTKVEGKEILKKSLPLDLVLLEETLTQEVLEGKFSHSLSDEVDNFNYEVKVRSEGVAFSRLDIELLAKERINSIIDKDKTIKKDSFKIEYNLKEVSPDEMTIEIVFSVDVYTDINLEEARKAVTGKSLEETSLFLKSLSGIEKVKIDKGSFMRRSVPSSLDKVKIDLILDPAEEI